jgi:hypothetical protein
MMVNIIIIIYICDHKAGESPSCLLIGYMYIYLIGLNKRRKAWFVAMFGHII